MRAFLCLLSLASAALASDKPWRLPEIAKSHQEKNQTLDCYDLRAFGGKHVTFTENTFDLATYEFDDMISSCCFYGIWIFYDEPDYNMNNLDAAVYLKWGENACYTVDTEFNNRASSIRLAGAPDDYKQDSLNLYEGRLFMGKEQYFDEDAPQITEKNLGASAIVSGCSPWTIYADANYQGESICLQPRTDTPDCYPTFFFEPAEIGPLASNVSSIRRGCFAKNKRFGRTL
ncbi:hypothetical protein TCAL_05345 [Tigriopus californicus]|uniref:Beta/gamma crystallin 'Greek key' domain-containing protein n=1 Tax=Tigriopus californicus TaxID=6832 RepID=A0A553PFK1_TIGCA|nr:uncharacterized protein LOC131880048 [Tigriopus californicus]TRY76468.1 hypothetical protein TCAL_05345 [Tigriopus californicus]|eukprot:TCALIF_05345-PA protein Name:"Similar to Crygd Gamma-crystallin D (Rattus norvegicus)" AED:0.08 eAED:0.08 QI:105/1/0.66/1/0/0/3/0/230